VPEWAPQEVQLPRGLVQSGAKSEQAASEIMQRWHDLGHTEVMAWVDYVPVSGPNTGHLSKVNSIRSNLINGLPPSVYRRITEGNEQRA
jgi:hypothetical protein